jgi:hypothetical protein
MRSFEIPRFLPVTLSVCAALFALAPVHASDAHGKNGSVILRMCKSADTVKMLSVMCRSYLDGYMEASHHFNRGKQAFCLDAGDKQRAPAQLVAWIEAHPQSLNRPAGEVLQKALTELFPCKGKQ